jgi:hypothetical protein
MGGLPIQANHSQCALVAGVISLAPKLAGMHGRQAGEHDAGFGPPVSEREFSRVTSQNTVSKPRIRLRLAWASGRRALCARAGRASIRPASHRNTILDPSSDAVKAHRIQSLSGPPNASAGRWDGVSDWVDANAEIIQARSHDLSPHPTTDKNSLSVINIIQFLSSRHGTIESQPTSMRRPRCACP